MRIMTIGMSPYLMTSKARIHASVIAYLRQQGHEVISLVWSHDSNYHTPELINGKEKFFFHFTNNGQKHKIRIIPFKKGEATTSVYDCISNLSPEIVLTIGDATDFFYMKAVKNFLSNKQFKWVLIATQCCDPINESQGESLHDVNAVLTTSYFGFSALQNFCPPGSLSISYIGADSSIFSEKAEQPTKFRVMMNAKKTPSDNIPMAIEHLSKQKDIQVYIHTNLYDSGDHDIDLIMERFDPNRSVIQLPERYVSIVDGITEQELVSELQNSTVFLSIPIVSGTSLTVFEALSCGCYPLMSDCGSNRNIAIELENHLNGSILAEDFLVRTIKVMIPGESYVSIPDSDDLVKKILLAQINIKKSEGYRRDFAEFARKYERDRFLAKLSAAIEYSLSTSDHVWLETV